MTTIEFIPKEEENQEVPEHGWYYCDACGGEFKPTTPPLPGQKLYELHECVWGKRQAKQDAIACKHCGKVTGPTHCDCPADIAQRKADADADDKKHKEDNERSALQHALFEKEREDKINKANEQQDKYFRASVVNGRKDRQRDQQDKELRDREQAVKGRELTRSEQRLDKFEAAAEAEDTEEDEQPDFASFQEEITLLDVARLPSAFVRDDLETLLYEGVANTIFGEVSSAKSWTGLMSVIQRLHAGRRVIWWDNEDHGTTVAKRLELLRASDLIGAPELIFCTGDLHRSERAMYTAQEHLAKGNGPGLVVIDSATAFTCPKDGGDVHPWMASHVKPWIDEGNTTLTLDHVPKQRKDRPAGAVGSYEKMSYIRGAALYIHGIAWDGKNDGGCPPHHSQGRTWPATGS